jgi:hypothetical protein
MREACNRTTVVHPFGLVASSGPAWRPGPTCHVTSATITTCKETAPPLAPMPCLLDCGTSAATRGSLARDPTVPVECNDYGSVSRGERRDGRYDQRQTGSNCSSRRAEAAVQSPTGSHPLQKQQGSPLPRSKDDAPVFRSSNGSRTRNRCPVNHRPVALTPWQGKRHLRQEKRALFRLRHNDLVKKRCTTLFKFMSFFFPSLSLLSQGPGKGVFRKRILPSEGNRPRSLLLIRGSKVAPPGVRQPPQSTQAPCPLLIGGLKAGPSEGFDSRPRARRARDDPRYVRYMVEARATLPRYPRTFPRLVGTIL